MCLEALFRQIQSHFYKQMNALLEYLDMFDGLSHPYYEWGRSTYLVLCLMHSTYELYLFSFTHSTVKQVVLMECIATWSMFELVARSRTNIVRTVLYRKANLVMKSHKNKCIVILMLLYHFTQFW